MIAAGFGDPKPPPIQARLRANQVAKDLPAAAELFRTHGFLWMENALKPAFVRKLHHAWGRAYGEIPPEKAKAECLEVGRRRLMVTVEVRPPFTDPTLYAHPVVLPLLTQLLGRKRLINSFGSVVAYPWSPPQHIHLDHPLLFDDLHTSALLPPYAITLVVPLVALTPATGCTAVFEGSHRDVTRAYTQYKLQDAGLPYAQLGDVYLMDYRLVHGGTGNGSVDPRPIMYLSYCRPWFSDAVNFWAQPAVQVPADGWDHIPQEHLRLFAKAARPM